MDELEKMRYIDNIESICNHIDNVQRNCKKLANAMIMRGELEFGKNLIAHAYIHDNSKFQGVEFDYLNNDNIDMLKIAIRNHQSINPHHPEYWGGIHKMPLIYIAEMAADWLARSQERGGSVMVWIQENATKKFGFEMTDEVGKNITFYISLMCPETFKNLNKEQQHE